VGSITSEGQFAFGFYSPPQCDGDGNIYLRPNQAPNYEKAPIWKLSPQAEKLAEFSLPSEFQDFLAGPSTVDPGGDVYQAAYDGKRVVVLKFAADGRFSNQTKVDVPHPEHFLPSNLAVFATGEILLAGYFSMEAPARLRSLPYVAIYHPDGRLLTKVSTRLPDGSNELPRDWTTVSGDWLETGIDGNAYSLRGSRILVISPAGQIVRAINLSMPGSGYAATKIQLSRNILSVQFNKAEKSHKVSVLFRTYDLASGDLLGEYVPDPELGNSPLCFSVDEGYTFFGNDHQKFQIKRGWVQ
jgi:hypothetical protein